MEHYTIIINKNLYLFISIPISSFLFPLSLSLSHTLHFFLYIFVSFSHSSISHSIVADNKHLVYSIINSLFYLYFFNYIGSVFFSSHNQNRMVHYLFGLMIEHYFQMHAFMSYTINIIDETSLLTTTS